MVLSEKTKYMLFSLVKKISPSEKIKYHKPNCIENVCNCQEIEQVDEFKYLGVIFDYQLNFTSHVSNLTRSINYSNRQLFFTEKTGFSHNITHVLLCPC